MPAYLIVKEPRLPVRIEVIAVGIAHDRARTWWYRVAGIPDLQRHYDRSGHHCQPPIDSMGVGGLKVGAVVIGVLCSMFD